MTDPVSGISCFSADTEGKGKGVWKRLIIWLIVNENRPREYDCDEIRFQTCAAARRVVVRRGRVDSCLWWRLRQHRGANEWLGAGTGTSTSTGTHAGTRTFSICFGLSCAACGSPRRGV